jgi:MFS family permease
VVAGLLSLLTVGDGFIYLALLDRGDFETHLFPLLYLGTNIAYLALAIPLGRLADRIGRVKVFVGGHLAIVGAYACAIVPISGLAATLVPLLLLGTFYAATDGVIAAIASRVVGPAARASGIAAAQTTVAVARLVSSTVFGVLWFTIGLSTALMTVALLLLVAIPVAFRVLSPLDRQEAAA